jgi:hypothetical protein
MGLSELFALQLAVNLNRYAQNPVTIHGYHIVTGFLRTPIAA